MSDKTSRNLPQIVGVAILYNGVVCALPKPARHHHIIHALATVTGESVGGDREQGFVLGDGSFLGRAGARTLAADNGQATKFQSATQLFSEDLW